eukprot:Lankesteria_metandrocarpae@DN2081_c0_g1_i1.p1
MENSTNNSNIVLISDNSSSGEENDYICDDNHGAPATTKLKSDASLESHDHIAPRTALKVTSSMPPRVSCSVRNNKTVKHRSTATDSSTRNGITNSVVSNEKQPTGGLVGLQNRQTSNKETVKQGKSKDTTKDLTKNGDRGSTRVDVSNGDDDGDEIQNILMPKGNSHLGITALVDEAHTTNKCRVKRKTLQSSSNSTTNNKGSSNHTSSVAVDESVFAPPQCGVQSSLTSTARPPVKRQRLNQSISGSKGTAGAIRRNSDDGNGNDCGSSYSLASSPSQQQHPARPPPPEAATAEPPLAAATLRRATAATTVVASQRNLPRNPSLIVQSDKKSKQIQPQTQNRLQYKQQRVEHNATATSVSLSRKVSSSDPVLGPTSATTSSSHPEVNQYSNSSTSSSASTTSSSSGTTTHSRHVDGTHNNNGKNELRRRRNRTPPGTSANEVSSDCSQSGSISRSWSSSSEQTADHQRGICPSTTSTASPPRRLPLRPPPPQVPQTNTVAQSNSKVTLLRAVPSTSKQHVYSGSSYQTSNSRKHRISPIKAAGVVPAGSSSSTVAGSSSSSKGVATAASPVSKKSKALSSHHDANDFSNSGGTAKKSCTVQHTQTATTTKLKVVKSLSSLPLTETRNSCTAADDRTDPKTTTAFDKTSTATAVDKTNSATAVDAAVVPRSIKPSVKLAKSKPACSKVFVEKVQVLNSAFKSLAPVSPHKQCEEDSNKNVSCTGPRAKPCASISAGSKAVCRSQDDVSGVTATFPEALKQTTAASIAGSLQSRFPSSSSRNRTSSSNVKSARHGDAGQHVTSSTLEAMRPKASTSGYDHTVQDVQANKTALSLGLRSNR